MAHFAKLDEDDNVTAVHVVHNNELLDKNGVEREELGIAFLIGLYQHPFWKQTSYNGNFRKNYAGVGFTYDRTRDAFIPPTPYPSWVLNETTCRWDPPMPYPTDGEPYSWNEDSQSWILVPDT
jgi:hypothetical protein